MAVLLFIMLFLLLAFYFYVKWLYSYWTRKGVFQLEPKFLMGNLSEVFTYKKSWGLVVADIYKEFKRRNVKHGGFYIILNAVYMPLDPNVIRNILLKDFNHFMNHGSYVNEEADPLTGHLFNLEDDKWRTLRTKLTPTFTSGKMKMMFQTFVICTKRLEEAINNRVARKEPTDLKEILASFTTDIIGNCAFGIECNSLRDPECDFRQYGRKIAERTLQETVTFILYQMLPRVIVDILGLKTTSSEVEKFFLGVVKETVDYREKNNVFRKDFMHLLLQLKNQGVVTDDETITRGENRGQSTLTFNELAAQCFVFFLAGYETSSTAMSFALFELALNPSVQDKLRKEINDVLERHNGQFTYEAVMEMSYLDKVILETLRKYPALPVIIRACNKTYKIPGTDFEIEKGTLVNIPIVGVHMDEEYYPEPEKFDPERFSEENKSKRPNFTYLPFGEGPRMCIGMRFGLLQSKVGLATIIRRFKIALNDKTITPIQMDPSVFFLSAKGKLWFDVKSV
ncbi:probable cytochrome P450 6a13 [Cylas formicarius]|uniref:probable cytochrome P450 6a13 n=1 Tax=Cylas formicarius TaxID=197179 RepID=UPI002958B0FE|nr:probable cytochrome P450 6a13 [Cylas formicarius]XP_060525155.1 probable cytochrome P450 6a13 [Cylas formicarius]